MHVSAQRSASGLTHILHSTKVQDIAHDEPSREIYEEPGDQAGAPRAGVGLQPPAAVADTDGADGADATLHRSDHGGLPPPRARTGACRRPVRPGWGGAIAPIASVRNPMQHSADSPLFTTRIAVVASDRSTAEMLHTFFRLMEFEIALVEADSGALDTIRRAAPAVVLIDLDLPDLRALELAREIGTEFAMIFMTAHGATAPAGTRVV